MRPLGAYRLVWVDVGGSTGIPGGGLPAAEGSRCRGLGSAVPHYYSGGTDREHEEGRTTMSGWFDEPAEEEAPAEEAEASPSGEADAHAEATGEEIPGGERRGEGRPDDRFERFRVKGDDLVAKVKELIHEGNVRKITIRSDEGRELLSFPLTAGVLGVALMAPLAAVAGVAALVGNCSIEVERRE